MANRQGRIFPMYVHSNRPFLVPTGHVSKPSSYSWAHGNRIEIIERAFLMPNSWIPGTGPGGTQNLTEADMAMRKRTGKAGRVVLSGRSKPLGAPSCFRPIAQVLDPAFDERHLRPVLIGY